MVRCFCPLPGLSKNRTLLNTYGKITYLYRVSVPFRGYRRIEQQLTDKILTTLETEVSVPFRGYRRIELTRALCSRDGIAYHVSVPFRGYRRIEHQTWKRRVPDTFSFCPLPGLSKNRTTGTADDALDFVNTISFCPLPGLSKNRTSG